MRGIVSPAVDALDRARRALYRVGLSVAPIAYVLRQRARRIEARACVAIVAAFALSVVAPAWMLALGPLLFGVPHVASEVRYLVVRRRLPRPLLAAVVVGCAAVSALRLLGRVHHDRLFFARAEVVVGALWIAGGALVASRRPGALRRLACIAPPVALAAAFALRHATVAQLAFVHAHNFGALLLWVVMFRRRAGVPVLALALLAAALALLVSGVTVPWSASLGALTALDVDVARIAAWLTPGVGASRAVPLALVHAFSDSVHYGAWLAIIPEEEIRAEGSLTFRMSLRALVADFGARGVAVTVAACAAVLAGCAVNLSSARGVYFSAAGFHGYLELAVIAWLVVAGELRPTSPARATAAHARLPVDVNLRWPPRA